MASGEPKIRPRESLWIAAPRKPRWVPGIVAIAFVAQIPGVLQRIVRGRTRETVSYLVEFAAYAAIVLLVVAWMIYRRHAHRNAQRDVPMVDGAFGEQFAIEATFVSEKQMLGTDRGVLWFADGLMGFSGAAAAFVLAASDVWVDRSDLVRNAKHRKQRVVVEFRDAPREGQVEIVPLRGHEDAARERLAAFLAADAPPEGERFWPPLVPYRAFEEGEPLSPQGL